ncbi:relaxase, partial [Klebsiella pneumoniae]|uniref:ATP-dependent DNA helicase n=1 Tax=Klebsiella pneumoniae TaxID=573 RepID=UPI000B64F586
LAVGDKVMVTRNDKTLDVANGDRFTVTGATEKGTFTLTNAKGREIELDQKQAAYLSYAYATTDHKAQGLTCDRVLFNIDTRSLTTSKDVFYVGISRARHEVEIFTDDKGRLLSSASRNSPKTTASEIDRFLGMEERYKDVNRSYGHDDGQQAKSYGHEAGQQTGEKENTMKNATEAAHDGPDTSGTENTSQDLRQREQEEVNAAIRYEQRQEATPEMEANPYHDYERYADEGPDYGDMQDYSTYEEYERARDVELPQHEHENHQHDYDKEGYGL